MNTKSRFILSYSQFDALRHKSPQRSCSMTGGVALISRTDTDNRFPDPDRVRNISLQKRRSGVIPIAVSQADVDGHRQTKLQSLPDTVIQPLHQLCSPGKGIFPGRPQLYRQNRTSTGNSPIFSTAGPAISRRDAKNPGAMSADVAAWHPLIPLFRRPRLQCLIDLLLRVFRSDMVALRRPAGYGLIPQSQNPGTSVLPKIRVGVIHPGIQQRHQHPVPIQIIPGILDRRNAGGCLSLIHREKQPLWFFDIFDFRCLGQASKPGFRYLYDRVSIQKLGCLYAFPFQKSKRAGILHNHFPDFFLPVIAHLQVAGTYPLLRGGQKRQIQKIFHNRIIHSHTLSVLLTNTVCVFCRKWFRFQPIPV